MRAYLSAVADKRATAPKTSALRWRWSEYMPLWDLAERAENEARRILADTEPENPGPSGFMAHPGCYVWQAGLFCAECMTPIPRAALAESLTAWLDSPALANGSESEAR